MSLGANVARSATCSTVLLFLPAAPPVIQIPYFLKKQQINLCRIDININKERS
jgi:hypothetical protein